MEPDRSQLKDWLEYTLDQYEGPLLRYAHKLTGALEAAKDVVQETFLRLCAQPPEKLQQLSSQSQVKAWLFKVCRNRIFEIYRKENRMQPLSDAQVESQTSIEDNPSLIIERKQEAHQAIQILYTLPENQREVLFLKFQNDLSYKEISEITNLSISHVGVLIHKGLKAIRKKMEKSQEQSIKRRIA